MPAKGFLTASQKENLQKALRESDSHHFRERILMLLLMNDGKTYKEIADFLGCAYRSVAYWCVHGDPDNLDRLRDQREQGNYRKVTQKYIQRLMEVIERNLACDFQEKGPKILIILDNASYHKRQDILSEIERSLPNIQLYFLPAYSPDFNLIELVWHSCKEYIAHRLFQSVEQLHNLLNRLLNEGELIIEWHRKIKHKGEALIAS
ncbi:MAG TPA: transposase [Waterburya sp.]|jgi:transposase